VHRVSDLAVNLGTGLDLDQDDQKRLALAGVLHDVGKIHLDPGILGKPGPLTEEERELMRRHPELGFAMTRNRIDPKVAEAILYHHERYDGHGYPFGLTGQEIPILSRIILVADAFDAMTSVRAYQPALPVDYAIDEIRRNAGSQFDPEVVEAFTDLAGRDLLPQVVASRGSHTRPRRVETTQWPPPPRDLDLGARRASPARLPPADPR